VQRALIHTVEVALVDDRTALQDQETVGIGLVKKHRERRPLTVDPDNRQAVELLLVARQVANRPRPAPNLNRWKDFPDVLE
jgi:hypothetical protein